jgi:imidazole glycerol phosphate synthase glutamine amidotransferase subunit
MRKTFVELIDVGGGNIGSVKRCLERLGVQYKEALAPSDLSGNFPLVLPGVGSFGAVMQHIQKTGFDRAVIENVQRGTPLLGICVGMQILFESSEESPAVPGLKLLEGSVVKYTQGKVPQIGWNKISPANGAVGAGGSDQEEYVYFVNSYYARPTNPEVIYYSAEYYETFCAAVNYKNICAFQFHPEKSGKAGQRLITRWLESVC